MPIPSTIQGREYDAFVECDGKSAKRVNICQNDGEVISVKSSEKGVVSYEYNELNIASGSTSTIINLIVAVGKIIELENIQTGGDTFALYDVLLNDNTFLKKRTYYGASFDVDINLNNKKIVENDDIKLKITNRSSSNSEFNATITYRVYDA